ncbi:MAG: GNAT family N-acetyltransferase [Pyrinomonadaceae bacterium]|nr:GNAT family N-acetyltransferase [Pyrinomonadaceae bacterium]
MRKLVVEENLELRELKPEDSVEIAAVVENCFDHLTTWLPWVNSTYTAKDTKVFIKRARILSEQGRGLQMAVVQNGRIVGGIGFNNIDTVNRVAEIGYWLSESATGKGLMTKCCKALVDHGFRELGLNRIVIRCATENTKSQAIPLRLGFTFEGISREAEKLHNKYVDLKVYSLLSSDKKPFDQRA